MFNLRFPKQKNERTKERKKETIFTILLTVTLVQYNINTVMEKAIFQIFFDQFQSLSVNIEKCKSSLLSSQQDNIKITTNVGSVRLSHLTNQTVSKGNLFSLLPFVF